jgi:hypothetical protein
LGDADTILDADTELAVMDAAAPAPIPDGSSRTRWGVVLCLFLLTLLVAGLAWMKARETTWVRAVLPEEGLGYKPGP